jgi:hypothetical protein
MAFAALRFKGQAKIFSGKISSQSARFFARRQKSPWDKEAKIIFPDAARAKTGPRNLPSPAPTAFRRR